VSNHSLLTRREFLLRASGAGATLIIGLYFPETGRRPRDPGAPAVFAPNAYLRIDNTGAVTVLVHRSEMGQGVQTALPMIVADELGADWSQVRVEQAPADRIYGDQVTGGSTSIQGAFLELRVASATARTWLIAAAAEKWAVDKADCYADSGAIVHRPSQRRLGFGELIETAAKLPKPRSEIQLKPASEFRIIGKRMGQIDDPHFVDGSARFASDIHLPGMLYATVARCPVLRGKVASYDASKTMTVEGVRKVVQIGSGVAVVAENTWSAVQGREALAVTWDPGANATLDSSSIRKTLADLVQKQAAALPTRTAVKQVEAVYEVPYLAHATIEPMTCVADVRKDKCEVWAPTQDRQAAEARALAITKLPKEAVTIHVPLIGCGCGRRIKVDYVDEAVQISQAVEAPVKVFWTREDDIQHDFYRPASYHLLRADLDGKGNPVNWTHCIAGQAINNASDLRQGASDYPYRLTASVKSVAADLPIPTGYWRSVYNTQNAFANESFVDEIAAASRQDPLALRLDLVDNPDLKNVLEYAATKANWGRSMPARSGQGIACHTTWRATHVAQVAEVSVAKDGSVRVNRVVCAVDCGLAVNPDMIEAQIEGGILFGLSAALTGEITLDKGRVQQSNLHDYSVLRMDAAPKVEVYIMPSDRLPQGVGEMGVPPIMPAVTNAIFAATGKRIRTLPIRTAELAQA
jgi:isoquinoline 1-oxidoreductase beta subunit